MIIGKIKKSKNISLVRFGYLIRGRGIGHVVAL